jgi:hypothetical protein
MYTKLAWQVKKEDGVKSARPDNISRVIPMRGSGAHYITLAWFSGRKGETTMEKTETMPDIEVEVIVRECLDRRPTDAKF